MSEVHMHSNTYCPCISLMRLWLGTAQTSISCLLSQTNTSHTVCPWQGQWHRHCISQREGRRGGEGRGGREKREGKGKKGEEGGEGWGGRGGRWYTYMNTPTHPLKHSPTYTHTHHIFTQCGEQAYYERFKYNSYKRCATYKVATHLFVTTVCACVRWAHSHMST